MSGSEVWPDLGKDPVWVPVLGAVSGAIVLAFDVALIVVAVSLL